MSNVKESLKQQAENIGQTMYTKKEWKSLQNIKKN